MRTVALWLFSPRTFQERPEFVEMIIQTGRANPHPFSLTGFDVFNAMCLDFIAGRSRV